MRSSLDRERELSYALLSEARAKRPGYDSQITRHALSALVTAVCPTITPYDWQVDLAEALTLGLDATVIAGTGSGKTLPWAMPLLLEENRDRICLVISPLNELEADHVRTTMAHVRNDTNLTVALLSSGSLFYHQAWDTRRGREQRHVERAREFHTKREFRMLTICARIC
jgi:ATP-dependent helicase YprA (DUF1998 family)